VVAGRSHFASERALAWLDVPVVRRSARALLVDPADRVLLVQLSLPGVPLWVAPGGGVEEHESIDDALDRELREEVGKVDLADARLVWHRRLERDDLLAGYDAVDEHWFLARVEPFEPSPELGADELRDEGVTESRWWTLDELDGASDLLGPRALPRLLRDLLAVPDRPVLELTEL